MNVSTAKSKMSYWWFPLLFGIIFILLGIWILMSPVESLTTLTKIIGVIAIVSGTTQLLFTVSNRSSIPGWGFQMAGGAADLAIGIILILSPLVLLKVISFFVGVWLLINSVTLFMWAGNAHKTGNPVWGWELAGGLLLLVLGVLFLWHPLILGITIAVWTGFAFIFLGVFRILLTIQLRKRGVPFMNAS
jgi:hypothetical protein